MKLTLIMLAVLLTACDQSKEYKINRQDYIIVEIDSCEYISIKEGYSGYLAHKGNCKFCEARRSK